MKVKKPRNKIKWWPDFVAERCEVSNDFLVPRKELGDAYIWWCWTNTHKSLPSYGLYKELRDIGYIEESTRTETYFRGLKLKPEPLYIKERRENRQYYAEIISLTFRLDNLIRKKEILAQEKAKETKETKEVLTKSPETCDNLGMTATDRREQTLATVKLLAAILNDAETEIDELKQLNQELRDTNRRAVEALQTIRQVHRVELSGLLDALFAQKVNAEMQTIERKLIVAPPDQAGEVDLSTGNLQQLKFTYRNPLELSDNGDRVRRPRSGNPRV